MFKLTNLVSLLAIVAAVGLLAPAPAVAQDCGDFCGACADNNEEGWGEDGDDYFMSCFSEDCESCLAPSALVAADMLGAGALAELVSTATAEELQDALDEYEGRIYIHPARYLLALTGVECSKDRVTSVVFLTHEQMTKLAAAEVPRLATLSASQ